MGIRKTKWPERKGDGPDAHRFPDSRETKLKNDCYFTGGVVSGAFLLLFAFEQQPLGSLVLLQASLVFLSQPEAGSCFTSFFPDGGAAFSGFCGVCAKVKLANKKMAENRIVIFFMVSGLE